MDTHIQKIANGTGHSAEGRWRWRMPQGGADRSDGLSSVRS